VGDRKGMEDEKERESVSNPRDVPSNSSAVVAPSCRVYVTASVCLSRRSTAAATCGRFAAELGHVQHPAIDSCRCG